MANKKKIQKTDKPAEYNQVLKSVGMFMEYWGFKAVHGKIWASIFLSSEPTDAKQLIEQLQLSKAAISLAIKDLLEYKVIIELEKEGPSTKKYVSNPNLVDVIYNVLRFREKKMLQMVVQNTKALNELSDGAKKNASLDSEKVQHLKEMCEQAQTMLEQILQFQNVSFKDFSMLLNMGSH